jgi:hypothetical protein
MLEVWHGASEVTNACIQAMAPGGEGTFYAWKGPVLVLAMSRPTGFMVDPGAYRDVQLHDFRDAADFLLDYGNGFHDQQLREILGTLGAAPLQSDSAPPQAAATSGNNIIAELE